MLRALGEQAGLAAWLAVYDPRHFGMRVLTLNDRAEDVFAGREYFSERAYVQRLYALRGCEAPPELLAALNPRYGNLD